MSLERRIERLERAVPWPPWPSHIEEAKQRCLARLKVRIGDACGTPEHPTVLAAQVFLVDDTPEQADQDRKALHRWAQQHPELMRHAEGARDRISTKVEQMVQRLEASHEQP
jgi:alkanesulfonate monooxygenase SsuD/methylene tetrahydromethanopterin reductase-like flavin-dependent oxidoreductase (luciferase family)